MIPRRNHLTLRTQTSSMSPPNLLTIPRELRQHILHYAIEDAANEDLKLNEILRKLATRFVDSHILPSRCHANFEGLLCYIDFPEEEGKLLDYAPHMCALALSLRSGLPELEDDIVFILGKSLSWFEEKNENLRVKSLDDMWRKYWAKHPGIAEYFATRFPRGQRMRPST